MVNSELSKYDSIRPFEPEELPAAYDRMLGDPQFQQVLAYLYPQVPAEAIGQKMRACGTCLDFQKAFCYSFLKDLMAKASKGMDMDVTNVDVKRRYTFVSNHRDIVLDSALLDVQLIDAGFETTCEIAIGDNLLSLPWVKDLVRINKSFIVERSLSPREMLMASKRLSEYMHFVIEKKNDNVWIAQREGRAKDSNDRTQPAILKMMAMGGEGTQRERLRQLHIVPLAISYELDPCDFLKAREMQLRRDVEGWKKSATDDIVSMRTGIMGQKGHVHYHCAPCIDEWLDQLPEDTPKTQFFDIVAAHIDQEIHCNYRIFPNNYVAFDLLNETEAFTDHYTPEERTAFEEYLESRVALINDVPGKDEPFLREQILTMYANPLINHLVAK
ncbi:MAG: 1-acyl-sn-glycerol-3-phosphate acyltransferase [Prevotella sp.]|nr:1-acyl-sn-glycerol-3-phosphate acyltransferase [Prevotella sp.]